MRSGALHGLPLGVKDLIDAEGLPTTFGSPIFKDNIADAGRRRRRALRAAGAIVLGKTNTPEWGAGGNTRNAVYGATGNPFDPTRSAAGSSGGSARRSPAAWCRSRPDPTPAARCAIRRPSAALSASARRSG